MIKDYLPCPEFWQSFLKKLFSLVVSVKVIILNATFIALWEGKLTSESFEHIVIGIAGVKVVTDIVTIYHKKKKKDENTNE